MSPPRSDVLIIDDDDIVRCALAEAIEEAGYTVEELRSPIGATRAVLQHGIRLVVLDVQMPAMRGDSLARLLRNNRRLSEVQVILISGAEEHELADLGRAVRVDGVVTKSAGPAALVAKVRHLLGVARAAG
jgi:CheY-like chemotaxis protein